MARGNVPDIKGIKKVRKPRGIKKDGTRSMDMCPGCHSFNCDHMAMSREYQRKRDRRHAQGVHFPCGTNPCSCKSSLDAKPQVISKRDAAIKRARRIAIIRNRYNDLALIRKLDEM